MKASANSLRAVFILTLLGVLFVGEHNLSYAADEKMPAQRDSMIRDPFLPLYPKKEPEKKVTTVKTTSIRPPTASISKKLPEFTVQGLVWGQTTPQAIINNKIVNIGDTIDEAKVIDISKEGVRLLYENDIILIKPQIASGGKK